MFDKNSYNKIIEFFSGVTWPFAWLGSRLASAGLIIFLFVLIASATIAGLATYVAFVDSESSDDTSDSATYTVSSNTKSDDANCNAVVINIRGCILTYRPDSADSLLGS